MRFALLFGFAVVVLAAMTSLTSREVLRLSRLAENVAEQHQLLEAEESLLYSVSEFERARLGYLLTSRETYLELLLTQRARASEALNRLGRAAEDGLLPAEALERVARMVDERFTVQSDRSEVEGTTDSDPVRRQAISAREEQRAGELRALVSGLRRQSSNRLAEILAEGQTAVSRTLAGMAVGAVLIAIALALSTTSVVRIVSRSETDRRRLHALEGELEQTRHSLHRRAHEMDVLAEFSLRLRSSRTPVEVYDTVAEKGTALFPDTAGGIAVLSDSFSRLQVEASWGPDAFVERIFTPEDCLAMKRDRIVRSGSNGPPSRCTHIPNAPSNPSVCLPMATHGETFGMLSLHSLGDSRRHDDSLEELADLAAVVAEQVALTLQSIQLRANLRNQSVRDPLTGLLSRRHMEETLEREIRRTLRHGRPVSLLMIDLDHFRQHNDTFGHDLGDATLKELARMLLRQTRGEDVCSRYGGGEFALILPETSLELALECAERVRREVRRITLPGDGKVKADVTVSIGVAACPGNGDTAELLIQSADAALHRSKAEGRNRVTVAESIVDPESPGTGDFKTSGV